MNRHETKNYILTGASGILGSHILYELMHAIHDNDYQGKLVILLRGRKDLSYDKRFWDLLHPEVIPDYLKCVDISKLVNNNVVLVDFDLRNIADISWHQHLGAEKYLLIHCAASVNLGTNAYAFEEIKHNNYLGSLSLVHSLSSYLSKVCYVSSAFSLSSKSGEIMTTNEGRSEEDYRNHYERYKVQTEKEIAEICGSYGIPCQILRPSIICGRLVDYPYHVIPRFLVFYLFGAFFYRAKTAYKDQHIRILMHETSGLNLIPVDYAARAIVRASGTDIRELNVVSRRSVPNMFTVPEMLRLVGWTNYEFIEEMPENQSAVEKLYYRTVGAQLSNYLMTPESPDTEFDIQILSEIMNDYPEPDVAGHFTALCNYAIEREFTNIIS